MKNLRFFKSLLVLIGVLIVGINQVNAETRRIYCKCAQSWWYADGAACGAYYWGSSSLSAATWPGVKMTETSSGSRVWYIDIDDSYTNVIFTRLNPSDSKYWSAKTGDLTISSSNNYYTISSTSGVWDPSTVSGSWSNKTYSITYKDQGNVAYSGSNSGSLTTSQKWGYALELIEGERDGYVFNGWYTNSSCTGEPITSLGISVNTNQTLYAKWTAETTYTITIANNINATTSTKSIGATPKQITAPTIADYAFSTWSAMPSGVTKTSGNLTDASIYVSATKAATVTANFNLIPVKLWTADEAKFASGSKDHEYTMSYDATEGAYYYQVTTDASPYYFRFWYNGETEYSCAWGSDGLLEVVANGSKQDAATDVTEYGTHTTLKYVGESGTTIKIWFDKQNGKTWITADKDKEYVLRGAFADNDSQADGMPGWGATTSYFEGLASGNTGTISCTLNANEWYHLKAYNVYTKTWWGPSSDTGLSDGTLSSVTSGGSGNFYFQTTVAGSYTFTLDKSSGIKLKVDFPVSYTVNFGVTPAAAADAPTNNLSISSGSLVASGTSITFTKDATPNSGYTWSHWEKNSSNVGSNNTYTTSITANTTVNAVYTEDMHTVTVTADSHGSVTTPASGTPRTVSAGIATGASIAASANTGYTFYNWTKTSGSGTVTFTNANANSTTVKATSDATVRANFVDQWNLKGDQWDNWDTYKPVPYVSSNTFRTTLTLTKGQKYKFKLVKRAYNGSGAGTTDTWYGNTNAAGEKALGRGAGAFTTATGGGVDDNLTVTPDVTGTYTFTINTSSTPTITVTYPTAYTITYGVGTINGSSTAVSVSPSFTSGDYVLPETDVTFSKGSTKAGYTWKGWYGNVGGTGDAWSTTDASLSLTATRTGNISVYACYNYATYTATLSTTGRTGYGSGAPANQTATYLQAMPTITPPTATNGYCFMGYWDGEEGTGTQYYNANGTSAHAWDKTSGATLYAYFKKAEFTTLEHNATVAKGDVITLDVNPVLNVTPVDYTAICWTLHYSENDNEVPTSGDHYYSVASYTEGGSKPRQVRFTMTNLAVGSYYVKAVLKAKASAFSSVCSEGTTLDTETGDFRIVGSSKITINYQYYDGGDVIAPSGMVEIEAESTAGIKAPNIIGYTFDSWSLGVGVTNTCADGTSCGLDKDSINISSPYDGVITAFYNKKQMIYFNNTLGWDDVYVYFYNTSNEYWANDYGTGANKKQYFNGQYPFGNGYYGHMTHIEGTDVWYFDYQAASIPTLAKVAFANKEQVYDKAGATDDEAYFHDASVVYRTDFDASHLSMFVPIDAVKHDYTANTGSKYYHGYWINYPENTGYKLMVFDGTGGSALFVKDQDFTHNANKRMPMSISLELEGGKTYGFKIHRDDATWWGNNGTMKNGASGDGSQTVWEFKEGNSYNNCGLTTTSSGIYTFTLSYGQDRNSAYNYLVGVRYPESVGDFRVQYKDNVNSTWKTSSVIPAVTESDTISYFVRKASTPYIRVQKCTAVDGSGNPTWTNQSSGANIISSLPSEITADGVYNFIFSKNNGALQLDTVASYTGNFYIRVGADGDLPWDNYRVSSQIMPFSEYSFNQTTNPYSHYFTKYYRTMNDNGTPADPSSINVTFVVANDYSTNISDTITTDDTGTSYVNASGILSGNNANIRFMYNYKTNVATRRYLDDAQGPRSTDFLLLIPSNNTSIWNAQTSGSAYTQVQLTDKGNWVYEANVWVVPGTQYQVRAKFGKGSYIEQYLKGASSGEHQYETLIGGNGGSRLQIRLLYDFKTNRVIAAYLPSGTIDENLAIDADIMFVREHQGNVTQITFGENKSISEIHNVYSVLRFNKSTINDYALSRYERDLFYISFPYNVRVSDIIGFGTYGTHWIIEYYDGADRAAKGFWKDSKSFWKFVTPAMASSYTLQAGTGYIVALDLDEMGYSSTIWDNTSTVELIFPGDISSISNQEVTYNMPIHQCNIGPRWEGASDRRIKDSHWNILGVPTYHNTTGSFANHTDEIGEKEQVWSADNAPKYLYTWNMTDNSLTVTDATGYNYKAMHAYVVQYYGDVTFHTSTNAVPAIVARRTYADAPSEVSFRMEIQQNDQMVDHTFVKLSNDETVSSEFVFGEDMSKEFNTNKANIYTMVTSILNDTATVTEVAGNILPMSDQTTVVPVGVTLTADGDYTFAIPDGTSGVGVTLVDTETGIRTSLSALSYTVNLTAGTNDGRFLLEIAPIQQTPTDIEEVTGDGLQVTGARKVIIDQKMYIIRDGKMYDARGAMIK